MKQLFIILILVSTTALYSQGKFELGYDNLKWNMNATQAKIILVSDTILSMKVQYRDGLVTKENGKLTEHTFQRVRAELERNGHRISYSCIFIDNSLCLIALYDIPFTTKIKEFKYLTEKHEGLFSDNSYVYPMNSTGWRTDGNVMIYLAGQAGAYDFPNYVILIRKDMKDICNTVMRILENDKSAGNEIYDIERP